MSHQAPVRSPPPPRESPGDAFLFEVCGLAPPLLFLTGGGGWVTDLKQTPDPTPSLKDFLGGASTIPPRYKHPVAIKRPSQRSIARGIREPGKGLWAVEVLGHLSLPRAVAVGPNVG